MMKTVADQVAAAMHLERIFTPFMKNRRLSAGILVLSAMLLFFSLAYASENPITFAGDKDFPPVEYLEQDVPTGLNIDLLKELGKAMGRKIDIRLMQWEAAQQKVLSGEVDAITTMAITEKRKEFYDFSDITLKYQYSPSLSEPTR